MLTDHLRSFKRCPNCALVFVPRSHHLSAADEKARYDHHQNNADDPRYQAFLNRLAMPVTATLKEGACGLDYGCGPEPVLSMLLTNSGFVMHNYDPFYHNDASVLERQYDFLTCSEAIEHFHNPDKEWRLWQRLVKKGGWIAIMTQMIDDHTDFANWYYKNDPTHICFYSRATFNWIAKTYNMRALFKTNNVTLLQVG